VPETLTDLAVPQLDLDEHEHLFIWRRREKLSQTDAAREFGLTRGIYQLCEEAKRGIDFNFQRQRAITAQEYCVLMRQRYGVTQEDIADALGVTRVWVNMMEAGRAPVEKLLAYWS
jgi:DNA-binding XRE family transcriptional regulator